MGPPQWCLLTKHTSVGPLLEVEMSKKCTPLWREAHFEVKSAKNWGFWSTFGRSDVVLRGRQKGLCTLSQVSKTWGFCSSFKNIGRRGTFEEYLQRCMSRGRRSTRDMFFRFAEMILRDRCSTSYDLASLFRGRRNTLDRWAKKKSQNALVRGRQLCTQLSIFEGSLADSFVFDVVNFEKWGGLAELLRFWCCQVQRLRKSRKIAEFLMLSSSKTEEVAQNGFVFKLVDRQIDR